MKLQWKIKIISLLLNKKNKILKNSNMIKKYHNKSPKIIYAKKKFRKRKEKIK
jgi:hypothetical protein